MWSNLIFSPYIFIPVNSLLIARLAFAEPQLTYVAQVSDTQPECLHISLDVSTLNSTYNFKLPGEKMGITSQVQNMRCDTIPLKPNVAHAWQVPSHWKTLTWEVTLKPSENQMAGAQQSTYFKNFRLLSGPSSIPRFEAFDHQAELKIIGDKLKLTVPTLSEAKTIQLTDDKQAPFFILLNPTLVNVAKKGRLTLNYYSDAAIQEDHLPDQSVHMEALTWLSKITASETAQMFNLFWMRLSEGSPGITGAAGHDILLVNYMKKNIAPLGDTMLLYVALHEAFHQLTENAAKQPAWFSESLASYFGLKSLKYVMPSNPNVDALVQRFSKAGIQMSASLTQADDTSVYYLKGVVFWKAVDTALYAEKTKQLEAYLPSLFVLDLNPASIEKQLNEVVQLPEQIWSAIAAEYL